MKTNKSIMLTIIGLFSSILAGAQTAVIEQDMLVLPQFLIVIISGVLLALGFQIILTAISIASGITALGDVRETYIKSKYDFKGKETIFDSDNDKSDNEKSDNDSDSTGLKVSMAFGVWSLITLSISLFLGTLLAMNLIIIASVPMAVTLSLVIWATFLMILFYFESQLANTLIGSLVGLATSGLKASGSAIKSIFGSSQQTDIKNVINSSIEKLRSEFSGAMDFSKMEESLREIISSGRKNVPDYEEVKKDLKDIISEAGKSGNNQSAMLAVKEVIEAVSGSSDSKNDSNKKSKIAKLKELYSELKDAYENGDSSEDKIKNVAAVVSPADEKTTVEYIDKAMDFIKTSDSSSMDSDKIQDIFKDLIQNPSKIGNLISENLSNLDRKKIVNLLNENTSLEKSQIEKYADKVEKQFGSVSDQISKIKDVDVKGKIEKSIRNFFDGAERKEVNYNTLKKDFRKAVDHPSDSFSIIKNRVSKINIDTLVSLLVANSSLEEQDIEDLKSKITDWKDEAVGEYHKMEDKANLVVNNAKRKAVLEAESIRKVAMSAAWWLVISSLVAGAAAVAGGVFFL